MEPEKIENTINRIFKLVLLPKIRKIINQGGSNGIDLVEIKFEYGVDFEDPYIIHDVNLYFEGPKDIYIHFRTGFCEAVCDLTINVCDYLFLSDIIYTIHVKFLYNSNLQDDYHWDNDGVRRTDFEAIEEIETPPIVIG